MDIQTGFKRRPSSEFEWISYKQEAVYLRCEVKHVGVTYYVKRHKIDRVLYFAFFPQGEIMAPTTQFRASSPEQGRILLISFKESLTFVRYFVKQQVRCRPVTRNDTESNCDVAQSTAVLIRFLCCMTH